MPSLSPEPDHGLSSSDNRKVGQKREDYLDWQEYFMAIAFLSAQRSKDPRTQVGACIVNKDKKIVGIGYNGMPIGCDDNVMPWNRPGGDSQEEWLQSKNPYVCHAELNAVLNKNQADVRGCSIYVALFPCNMCAQIIIQSGIKEVIYYSDKYDFKPPFKASRFLLSTAGVACRQFKPRQKQVVIDFNSINDTPVVPPTLPMINNFSNGDAVKDNHTETSKHTANDNGILERETTLRKRTNSHPQENEEHHKASSNSLLLSVLPSAFGREQITLQVHVDQVLVVLIFLMCLAYIVYFFSP